MFQPTHYLVSRSRKTPVRLVSSPNGFQLLTAVEFLNQTEAAFEMRPHLGMFCKGVPVVGYTLQPMMEAQEFAASASDTELKLKS